MKFCSPITAKVMLSGVQWLDGTIAESPEDKAKDVGVLGSKVFAGQLADEGLAEASLTTLNFC